MIWWQKIKRFISNLLNSYLNNFREYKKTVIRNYIIFFISFFILILIDQLSKKYIFEMNPFGSTPNNNGAVTIFSNSFLAIKILWHHGFTAITNSNDVIFNLSHFVNFLILLIILIIIPTLKSKTILIGLAMLFSGTLGNLIDRLAFNNNVRDIISFPWYNNGNGVFNFADAFAVISLFLMFIFLLLYLFSDYFVNKKRKIRYNNELKKDQILNKNNAQISTNDLNQNNNNNDENETKKDNQENEESKDKDLNSKNKPLIDL